MARMYPEDIEGYERATGGEKRFFRFIQKAARPHKDYVCWYEPSTGGFGKEPDFVLFGKRLGLIVFEVKDWASHQIVSFNPHQFTLVVSGERQTKTHPDRQAKGYVDSLQDKLKKFPPFLSSDPQYRGGLEIPIGRMVIFPNITREQYAESKFKWLLDVERVLFGDEMEPAGEILRDDSGRKFRDRVSGCLPFPFRGLGPKEVEKLCFVLWPEAQIEVPLREGAGRPRFQKEVSILDDEQARLALRLGGGHQIIKGPPGSGKTLVLAHRCCHLAKYNPEVNRILLVCFNIALVSYLKRLLQEKGVGLGENGVEVCHFFELCSTILGEKVRYENEDADYYDLVVQETLDRVTKDNPRIWLFDAILLDEGQDFDNDMLKVLLALLKPGGNLVISMDPYQDLYRQRPTWKSIGVKASGRTRHLKQVYRSTMEIFEFTQRFIGERSDAGKKKPLLPYDFAFHGGPPELVPFKTEDEMYRFLSGDIQRSIARDGYKRSEIAVIYDDKVYGPDRFAYDNRALPMRLITELESAGVPAVWVSQDVRSKEMYDITTDRVSLISIHSSKGLDFDLVYLMGIDRMKLTPANRDALTSLVYVAMTRAKYRLVIPYVRENEMVARLKASLRAR